MLYKKPTFSLPAVGQRKAPCDNHTTDPWLDGKGRCVQCGQKVRGPVDRLPDVERAD